MSLSASGFQEPEALLPINNNKSVKQMMAGVMIRHQM